MRSTNCGRSGAAAEPALRARRCRCRSRTYLRSGRSATRPSRYNWMLQCHAPKVGVELDRHRPPDLQLSTPTPISTVAARFVCRPGDGAGRLVVARSRDDRRSSAAYPERCRASVLQARSSINLNFRCSRRQQPAGASSASSSTTHSRDPDRASRRAAVERRLVVEHDVVKRVGDDFGKPDRPTLPILDEEQMHGAEQQPPTPTAG